VNYLKARSNPSFGGVNIGRVLFDGAGLFLAAAGNDLVVAPILKPMISSLPKAVQKGADAITTAVVAVVGGKFLGMVHRELGTGVYEGGLTLAGAKVISMAVPGFQLGATTPHSISDVFAAQTAMAAATTPTNPALNPASASANNSTPLAGAQNLQLPQGQAPGVFNEFGGKLAGNQNWAL
jgi:hypothetical protein